MIRREHWRVTLEVDGRRVERDQWIQEPFGVRRVDAVTAAIRRETGRGLHVAGRVRVLDAKFVGAVEEFD